MLQVTFKPLNHNFYRKKEVGLSTKLDSRGELFEFRSV